MNVFSREPESVTSLRVGEDDPIHPDVASSRRMGAAGSQARILYVDDEPIIRSLGKLVLARSGYAVDTAADGVEGWAALQDHDYNLLITDNHMPGLNGLELIRKVRLARMRLPIVLASAMLGPCSIDALPLSECGAVLAKPFTSDQLISVVREVLRTEVGARTSPSRLKLGQSDGCLQSHQPC